MCRRGTWQQARDERHGTGRASAGRIPVVAVRRLSADDRTSPMRRLQPLKRLGPLLVALGLMTPASATPVRSDLIVELTRAAPDADPEVISLALRATACARAAGVHGPVPRLAVIDYSKPSTQPRLWVFDLDAARLLFRELVAHGRGTGERLATRFSNVEGSRMSSLGLFRTAGTYVGGNGYSLRLEGLESGFNDRAESRAIVMHGAPYVSRMVAERFGRLGRSWGCPAVRREIARPMIDTIKGGALLFAYYPDQRWLDESRFLSCPAAAERTAYATVR